MHVLWTFACGVANDTRLRAACCQQIRRMEKSILTILTLDGENLPCFSVLGSYVIIRGNATLCLAEGPRSRVSSSIFLLAICLVTRYSKM